MDFAAHKNPTTRSLAFILVNSPVTSLISLVLPYMSLSVVEIKVLLFLILAFQAANKYYGRPTFWTRFVHTFTTKKKKIVSKNIFGVNKRI